MFATNAKPTNMKEGDLMKTKQIIEIELITAALLVVNKELRKRLLKLRYENKTKGVCHG